jgi:hypothetical protein
MVFRIRHSWKRREAVLIGFGPVPCTCSWQRRWLRLLLGEKIGGWKRKPRRVDR